MKAAFRITFCVCVGLSSAVIMAAMVNHNPMLLVGLPFFIYGGFVSWCNVGEQK